MEIFYLIGLAVFLGVVTVFALKWFGSNSLFVLAIGCAIAANVYNIDVLCLDLWGMRFGIDSVVYTTFVFCVFLMQYKYSTKDAITLTYCTIFSIVLTGFFRFLSDCINFGIDKSILWGFVSYIISAIATYVAIIACVKVFEALKGKWKSIFIMLLFILVGSLINSLIYFGGMSILTLTISEGFVAMLSGSYIGKLLTTIIFVAAFILFEFITKEKVKKEKEAD